MTTKITSGDLAFETNLTIGQKVRIGQTGIVGRIFLMSFGKRYMRAGVTYADATGRLLEDWQDIEELVPEHDPEEQPRRSA